MKNLISGASMLLFSFTLISAQHGAETMSLDECIERAFSQNLSLQQSAQRVEEAALQIKTAYGSLYPSISASTGGNISFNNPKNPLSDNPYKSLDFTVGLSQSIYSPGLFLAPKVAAISEDISHLNRENLRSTLRQAVEENYFTVLSSMLLINVYEENIRMNNENIKKVKTMVELGISKKSDILK
ncbi:MAG TPA: TolC family protein, partial [Candidatus Marinimicrobia bacterium]|nr:TolC family protein [Candidatus Neomarinimicrobiota bacterium]